MANKRTNANLTAALCALLIGMYVGSASAYEPDTTHATITEIAVTQSRLATDASLLERMGLAAYGQNVLNTLTPDVISGLTILELIKLGSVDEDGVSHGFPTPRSFFHFYDPQNNRGMTTGSTSWLSSPDWSLEDNGTENVSASQFFSYRDARRYYFQALSLSSPGERQHAFTNMFKSLGHVVHHVQDMGQPQHTRNHIHCNKPLCEKLESVDGEKLFEPSEYEAHTAFVNQHQRILSGSIPTTTYPIPSVILAEPRDYWVSNSVAGAGMAEFVAQNFITVKDRVEYNPALSAFRSHSSLPLPDGANWFFVTEPCSVIGSFGSASGTCDFVRAPVTDPLTNQSDTYIVATPVGVFNRLIQIFAQAGQSNVYYPALLINDATTFDSRYEILLPRIVSFSTGMIDYFFRGDVRMEFETGGTWRIKNFGTETVSGQFRLFSESSTLGGVRSEVVTHGWDNRFLTLSPNQQSAPINFVRPTGSSEKFMLTFEGQIGEEGKPGANTLEGIAGSQKKLPEITIRFGDNGPLLDDIFSLSVVPLDGAPFNTNLSNYKAGSFPYAPVSTHTVVETNTPGQYRVELKSFLNPCQDFCDVLVPTDSRGWPTYFIEFSSNVTVNSGPTSSGFMSGNSASWNITVND